MQNHKTRIVCLTQIAATFLAAMTGLHVVKAYGQVIPLQNATATFTQPHEYLVDLWAPSHTIDGIIIGDHTSWAVYDYVDPPVGLKAQTIVWETVANADPVDGQLRFNLYHGDTIPILQHSLGCFRLSYTTDDRSQFADGLQNGGDVTANWTVINPDSAQSSGGETILLRGDGSLLVVGGPYYTPTYPTYTVDASIHASGITGFRLEALNDPSLPFGGPGREPTAGNFHLSEFVVSAVPEPPGCAVAACVGLVGLALSRRFWPRRQAGNGCL